MKKLMTIVMAIVLIAGFTSTTKAQISIGVKAGIALPMVTPFSDGYGLGFGGSAIGEYALNDNMAVGLNAGFYTFGGKDLPSGVTKSFNVIPIIADFKYFFMTEDFKPYIGLGLGMYMATSKYSATAVDISTSESNFGFAPKLGFWMGKGIKYGASFEYNIVSAKFGGTESTSFAHLGINVGFIYPLGK